MYYLLKDFRLGMLDDPNSDVRIQRASIYDVISIVRSWPYFHNGLGRGRGAFAIRRLLEEHGLDVSRGIIDARVSLKSNNDAIVVHAAKDVNFYFLEVI